MTPDTSVGSLSVEEGTDWGMLAKYADLELLC